MLSIIWLNSASLRTGLLGMWMRPKWLVTPRGRMASNSGCTVVLVEGAITPNFLRKPRESVIGRKLELRREHAPYRVVGLCAKAIRAMMHRQEEPRIMLRNGKEHLESLRDGRVVYVGGE